MLKKIFGKTFGALCLCLLISSGFGAFAQNFLVCLGSFEDKTEAENCATALMKEKVPTRMAEYVSLDGKKVYRLFLDQDHETQELAKKHMDMLSAVPAVESITGGKIWISQVSQVAYDQYFHIESESSPSNEVVDDSEEMTLAEAKFNEIAQQGKGEISYSFGGDDLSANLICALDELKVFEKVELVFAIDATGSMDDDFYDLCENWIPKLREQVKAFKELKIGLVLYKDFEDEYRFQDLPVKVFDFTTSIDSLSGWISNAYVNGGGDVPEAVYEALYAGIKYFNWSDDAKKKIILIGDAEPHSAPRGRVNATQDLVVQMAREKNIILDTIIILPETEREEYEERTYRKTKAK